MEALAAPQTSISASTARSRGATRCAPFSTYRSSDDPREARYMYYSTLHWKPIANGYSGFAPAAYRRAATSPSRSSARRRGRSTTCSTSASPTSPPTRPSRRRPEARMHSWRAGSVASAGEPAAADPAGGERRATIVCTSSCRRRVIPPDTRIHARDQGVAQARDRRRHPAPLLRAGVVAAPFPPRVRGLEAAVGPRRPGARPLLHGVGRQVPGARPARLPRVLERRVLLPVGGRS